MQIYLQKITQAESEANLHEIILYDYKCKQDLDEPVSKSTRFLVTTIRSGWGLILFDASIVDTQYWVHLKMAHLKKFTQIRLSLHYSFTRMTETLRYYHTLVKAN